MKHPTRWLVSIFLAITLMPAWGADSPSSSFGQKSTWKPPSRRSATPTTTDDVSEDSSGGESHAPFTPGSHNVALDLGQVFLMGDLGDRYSDNIGTGIHYDYGVSELFAFDGSFGYSSHSNGDLSLMSLLLGLRANLSWYDRVIPHAILGLGFYRPSTKLSGTSTESPVLFGLHLGPGLDLQISDRIFFGAGLTFHDMFGGNRMTSVGQRDLGGTYTTFMLRIGVSF